MKKLILFLAILTTLINTTYSQIQRLRLRVENVNQVASETIIAFIDDATDGVDNQYDAISFPGNAELILYTTNSGSNYSIQAWPILTSYKVIPLGITNTTPGVSKIYLNLFENFDSTTLVYLEDTELDTLHNIVVNQYTFDNVGLINNTGRFKLHFYAPILISTINECADKNVGEISINNPNNYEINAKLKIEDSVIDSSIFISNHTFTGLTDGIYTLSMSYINNNINKNIEISNPMSAAIANSTTDSAIITDSQIEFTGSVEGASNIMWNFGDNTIIYNDLNPVHSFNNLGDYQVYFIAENGDCISIDTINIVIYDINHVHNTSMDVSIFPNPIIDVVKLKSTDTFIKAIVKIYNMSGILVSNTNVNNYSEVTIPIDNLACGIYELVIEYENGNKFTKKIIKR